jgi:D-aminopeptidase
MAAMQKGGLGSVSMTLDDGTTVGALVVVNALGSVTTPGDKHFWAAPFEMGSEFGGMGVDKRNGLVTPEHSRKEQAMMLHATQGANTTIAIVATDATLTKVQCHRLAVTAHDGMARAIVPSHTPLDGDLVFGVSTGEGDPVDQTRFREIAAAAAVCLSRAIARGVYEATPAKGDIIPTYKDMNSLS